MFLRDIYGTTIKFDDGAKKNDGKCELVGGFMVSGGAPVPSLSW